MAVLIHEQSISIYQLLMIHLVGKFCFDHLTQPINCSAQRILTALSEYIDKAERIL